MLPIDSYCNLRSVKYWVVASSSRISSIDVPLISNAAFTTSLSKSKNIKIKIESNTKNNTILMSQKSNSKLLIEEDLIQKTSFHKKVLSMIIR